jgi:hypothetical protein
MIVIMIIASHGILVTATRQCSQFSADKARRDGMARHVMT